MSSNILKLKVMDRDRSVDDQLESLSFNLSLLHTEFTSFRQEMKTDTASILRLLRGGQDE